MGSNALCRDRERGQRGFTQAELRDNEEEMHFPNSLSAMKTLPVQDTSHSLQADAHAIQSRITDQRTPSELSTDAQASQSVTNIGRDETADFTDLVDAEDMQDVEGSLPPPHSMTESQAPVRADGSSPETLDMSPVRSQDPASPCAEGTLQTEAGPAAADNTASTSAGQMVADADVTDRAEDSQFIAATPDTISTGDSVSDSSTASAASNTDKPDSDELAGSTGGLDDIQTAPDKDSTSASDRSDAELSDADIAVAREELHDLISASKDDDSDIPAALKTFDANLPDEPEPDVAQQGPKLFQSAPKTEISLPEPQRPQPVDTPPEQILNQQEPESRAIDGQAKETLTEQPEPQAAGDDLQTETRQQNEAQGTEQGQSPTEEKPQGQAADSAVRKSVDESQHQPKGDTDVMHPGESTSNSQERYEDQETNSALADQASRQPLSELDLDSVPTNTPTPSQKDRSADSKPLSSLTLAESDTESESADRKTQPKSQGEFEAAATSAQADHQAESLPDALSTQSEVRPEPELAEASQQPNSVADPADTKPSSQMSEDKEDASQLRQRMLQLRQAMADKEAALTAAESQQQQQPSSSQQVKAQALQEQQPAPKLQQQGQQREQPEQQQQQTEGARQKPARAMPRPASSSSESATIFLERPSADDNLQSHPIEADDFSDDGADDSQHQEVGLDLVGLAAGEILQPTNACKNWGLLFCK